VTLSVFYVEGILFLKIETYKRGTFQKKKIHLLLFYNSFPQEGGESFTYYMRFYCSHCNYSSHPLSVADEGHVKGQCFWDWLPFCSELYSWWLFHFEVFPRPAYSHVICSCFQRWMMQIEGSTISRLILSIEKCAGKIYQWVKYTTKEVFLKCSKIWMYK